jgi:hypothetical protein
LGWPPVVIEAGEEIAFFLGDCFWRGRQLRPDRLFALPQAPMMTRAEVEGLAGVDGVGCRVVPFPPTMLAEGAGAEASTAQGLLLEVGVVSVFQSYSVGSYNVGKVSR